MFDLITAWFNYQFPSILNCYGKSISEMGHRAIWAAVFFGAVSMAWNERAGELTAGDVA